MKISIIVPIYNASKYLKECINSIIQQTYQDLEIILINDGSTDESQKIIDEYKERDKRIISIERENKGISYTRNQGIKLATGDYIMFLDSDDYLENIACQELIEAISQTESDLVVCDFVEFDEKNKRIYEIPKFSPCTIEEKPHLLFDINSSPWNKMYRHGFLIENQIFFPENLKYEDAYFVLKSIVCAKKISQVKEMLINYRVHTGSETTVINERVFDIFVILDLINKEIQSRTKNQDVLTYLEFFNINRLTVYNLQQAYQKNKLLAKKFIDQSFNYLNSNFPNWKKNLIFKERNSWIKMKIKTSKSLTNLMNKITK